MFSFFLLPKPKKAVAKTENVAIKKDSEVYIAKMMHNPSQNGHQSELCGVRI